MTTRSDHQVVKAIHGFHGVDAARTWQRLPYVVLPGQGFTSYLLMGESRSTLMTALGEGLSNPNAQTNNPIGLPLENTIQMPWNDLILDMGESRSTLMTALGEGLSNPNADPRLRSIAPVMEISGRVGNTWVRIRKLSTIHPAKIHEQIFWAKPIEGQPNPNKHPVLFNSKASANPERWALLEFYDDEYVAQRLPLIGRADEWFAPDVVLVPLDHPASCRDYLILRITDEADAPIHKAACDACQEPSKYPLCPNRSCPHFPSLVENNRWTAFLRTSAITAIKALFYIHTCTEHLVRVRGNIPAEKAKRHTKTSSLKPWLREDLPRIILIDPARVVEYRDPPRGGRTHASPRPHNRRGHWKTLSAERFKAARGRHLWIKPTWIGDTEWQSDGQIYKVLPDPTAQSKTAATVPDNPRKETAR